MQMNKSYSLPPLLISRLFATLMWYMGEFIDSLNVFERDFRLDDPLISHPHTKQQRVTISACESMSSHLIRTYRIGGTTNNLIAVLFPLTFFVFVSLKRKQFIDLHHGALGLWVSRLYIFHIYE